MLFAQLLAWTLLVLHFAILGFLSFGGFVAWRWPRALYAHIPLVLWGVASSVWPLACPVTTAENWAREAGGLIPYDRGFVETYLEGVLYDPHHVNRFRAVMALLVLIGWAGAAWCARRRSRLGLSLSPAPAAATLPASRCNPSAGNNG
ncbi:DUF2784 domain-containing protein [Amycolatopsis panacis]|uniref:DUF2784 domain-containing protein n=1 Tax=Amycolatopsis panacis TaxID=2340917 RepID=UPI0013144DA9|nr:DUF2784 domain-containing protein [Amycolatopsis panacis]